MTSRDNQYAPAQETPAQFLRRLAPHAGEDLSTNHAVVDQIGRIKLHGLIIDWRWMRAEKLCHRSEDEQTGATKLKPYLTAILVLADIVEWFRPYVLRDPEGVPYGQRKLKTEFLIKTYEKWGRDLGLTKGQIEDAVTFLYQRGIIGKRPANDHERAITGAAPLEKPLAVWPIVSAIKDITGCADMPTQELTPDRSSGSEISDALMQIPFKGDVIDFAWLKHWRFRTKNGQGGLNIVAVFVFAQLFFLHTPTERVNNVTGQIMKRTKKFRDDVLFKIYAQWEALTGLSDRQLRAAVAFLKNEAGLIRSWSENIRIEGGLIGPQVARIELIVEATIDATWGPAQRTFQTGPEKTRGTSHQSLQGASKLAPKKREVSPDAAFSSVAGPEKTRELAPIFREDSPRKNETDIVTEHSNPTIHHSETQKALPLQAANAGGEDVHSELLRSALALQTGVPKRVLESAIKANAAHVALWVQWWPKQPESKPSFWEGRSGSTAAAFRLRIEDEGRLPDEVVAARQTDRQREEHLAKAQEQQTSEQQAKRLAAAKLAQEQAQREAEALEAKRANSQRVARLLALDSAMIDALVAVVAKENPFMARRATGGLRAFVESIFDENAADIGLMQSVTEKMVEVLNRAEAESQASAPAESFEDAPVESVGEATDSISADAETDEDAEPAAHHPNLFAERLVELLDNGWEESDLDRAKTGTYALLDADEWDDLKCLAIKIHNENEN